MIRSIRWETLMRIAAAALLAGAPGVSPAAAQTVTGTIAGTIVDEQQQVIPGGR